MPDFTEKPDLGEFGPNKFFDVSTAPFDIEKHMLYEVISGSIAYGLNTPTSDVDIRGVVMPPREFLLGLRSFEQIDNQKKDVCFYSLKKFIELILKNNVHALEMIWMPDEVIKYVHPIFQQLIDKRKSFLSKQIGYTCGGYAMQQVHLMFTKKVNNSGRQDLIQKHGFDTKMGAHALRILRMGTEALTNGELIVRRPDREELMEVKNGKYKLHEMAVLGENEDGKKSVVDGFLAEEFKKFNDAWANSSLPDKPDYNALDRLLIDLQEQLLGEFSV